jgi:hypothetical protein
MKTNIFIPKKINVGYQKRTDTYTKKLAYVIYYDQKGVLRKETSWQNWRDKKIPNTEFENEPIEGFVLNKGVGGQRHSYGWNARNEYIRVYDPRDFEFEISVANLLWILQECTSTKGKGLEGQFVYGWQGKELILIPVETKEYDDCMEYTNTQDGKITARELQPGFIYRDNTMKDWIYLGRLEYFEHPSKPYYYTKKYGGSSGYYYGDNDYYLERDEKTKKAYERDLKPQKRHIFIATEKIKNYDGSERKDYYYPKTMNKFKQCMSTSAVDNFAELLEDFQTNCKHASSFKEIKFIPVTKDDLNDLHTDHWGHDYYKNEVVYICKKINGKDDNQIQVMPRNEYDNYSYQRRNDYWETIDGETFMKDFKNKVKIYHNNYTEKIN